MTKSRLGRALTLAVGVVCAAYLVIQLHGHWPEIRRLDWTSGTALAFAAAAVLQALAVVFDGWCWAWLLRRLGMQASSRTGTSIFCVSQFAKYLPGNVGQHVGRVALAHASGFQTGRVVLSLLLENGFALGAGALIAASGAFLAVLGDGWTSPRVAAGVVFLGLGWITGTLVLKRLLSRPPRWLSRVLSLEEPLDLRSSTLAFYFLTHLLSYAALAVVFAILVQGLSGELPARIWVLPVAVTVGWLAGYLVPGAPAGLGVREAALTTTLGPTLGIDLALSAALLWRVSSLGADALALLVGLSLKRKAPPRPS